MTDRQHGPIGDAYARYDSDPRAHGPQDFDAFADAVEELDREARREVAGMVVHILDSYEIKRRSERKDRAS
jgi:hypothetical protein